MSPPALAASGSRAPRRRARAERHRSRPVRQRFWRHARPGHGRGPRAAVARRRARGAPRPRACGAARRQRGALRAAAIRSATAADASDRSAASSVARGRGTVTTRSKRSSSARESLSRYEASRCVEQEHSCAGSPRAPQGHRFIVAISWKRAGYTARPSARATLTTPSSIGWRSASSACRWNSGSSSRRSTPRCARLTSPGRAARPPPTSAAIDALWCGARKGGWRTSGCSRESSPETEWMRVTSSASSGSRGGRIPGRRRASIVLPVPGGPASSRLCRPAAASSSARRARSWPRTSARSGNAGSCPFSGGSYGDGSASPRRYAAASARCRTGTGSIPARDASAADSAAQSSRSAPARRAASATASTPPTGRTRPSSASSPTAA